MLVHGLATRHLREHKGLAVQFPVMNVEAQRRFDGVGTHFQQQGAESRFR